MQRLIRIAIVFLPLFLSDYILLHAQNPKDYFKIRVIDSETNRGVPMVELKTTNSIRYYTDNNGLIAFYEPGLMGMKIYFSVTSPGYEFPPDFFGVPGQAFKVVRGDSVQIKIKRINVAERLYRYTGEGLYHHSLRLGYPAPIKQPVLNAQVTGLDGTMALPYNGKIYWTWGDTEKISSSLGHLAVSGAISELPANGGLDPDIGIDLTFFVDENGFSKQMCPLPGPGMVWNHWMGVLPDEKGKEQLILHFGRMKNVGVVLESGLAAFNENKKIFESFFKYNPDLPFWPKGHYLEADVKGTKYHYFSFRTPYSLRCIANLEHIKEIKSYEAFTCLKEGTKYKGASSEIDRNEKGEIVYSWKKGTDPVDYKRQKALTEKWLMKQEEGWLQLLDFESGTRINSHAGSVYWNQHRNKWIMIMQGSDELSPGDIWYGEGDTPVGPWVYLKKVATHNEYNLYNVTQLPFFDKENGRYIYFDGTFSNTFTKTDYKIPRYDYNLIMYRLDLNDPRLYLPVPVYTFKNLNGGLQYLLTDKVDSQNLWNKINNIPFFALAPNRKIDGSIDVYQYEKDGKVKLSLSPLGQESGSYDPVFCALPILIQPEEKLSGTWKCKAGDFPLKLDIEIFKNEFNLTFNDKSLLVTKTDVVKDSLVIHVKDTIEGGTYIIFTSFSDGKMNGRVKEADTEESFLWEGERIDLLWKQHISSTVVTLYEYQNRNGDYSYSTDPRQPGEKHPGIPICKVWKNPSTTLALDFEARPVHLIK